MASLEKLEGSAKILVFLLSALHVSLVSVGRGHPRPHLYHLLYTLKQLVSLTSTSGMPLTQLLVHLADSVIQTYSSCVGVEDYVKDHLSKELLKDGAVLSVKVQDEDLPLPVPGLGVSLRNYGNHIVGVLDGWSKTVKQNG